MKGSMKKVAAGVAATLLVALFGQSAMADTYTITTYSSMPLDTTRVIESPVVVQPAATTCSTMETPVVIRENPVILQGDPVFYGERHRHHLLNLGAPFVHLNLF